MPTLDRDGDVYLLHLGDDENRFTLDWIQQVHALLDEVVSEAAPLVTTGGGKLYSNGLDLEWVLGAAAALAPLAGKDAATLGAIKSTMFAGAAEQLRAPMLAGRSS
jgi:enoyl-CoA hydratase/carnithine racemase